MRDRSIAVGLAGLTGLVLSCAAIVGLEDHQLAPTSDADGGIDGALGSASDGALDDGRAADARDDAPPCTTCSTAVLEVAASGTHACAVLKNGELWCWGKSQLGALGVDPASTTDVCSGFACRPTPARVPGLSGVVHVALTDDVTCAVDASGAIACAGRNASGALGHRPTTDPQCATARAALDAAPPATEPCRSAFANVALPPGTSPPAQLVAGAGAVCARTGDGHVDCWGDDALAEDGVFPIPAGGIVSDPTSIPGVPADSTAIALSAANAHGCTLGALGVVSCWGANVSGELGHPSADAGDDSCAAGASCNPAASVVNGIAAKTIAAGSKTSCAIAPDGAVWCWGANDAGQLGNGESADDAPHPSPTSVTSVSGAVALELRYESAFAIDGSGHVTAWGLATDGALGLATPTIVCTPGNCVPSPVRVPALDGARQIASTKAGGVALKSDGSVWAWGINDLGQLAHAPGNGDATCASGPCSVTPVRVMGLP